MAKRKYTKAERRWLKKAGFGREVGELGGLACALHEAQTGVRPAGYDVTPDLEHGRKTRRRVRRARLLRCWRVLVHGVLMGLLYGGAVGVVVVVGVLAWLLCG